jgi:hypothetical protein
MNGRPEEFAQKLRDALPLGEHAADRFNENSFDTEGRLHDQYERFLTAAVAEGFEVIFVYSGGTEQRAGAGGEVVCHGYLADPAGQRRLSWQVPGRRCLTGWTRIPTWPTRRWGMSW